MTHPVDASYRSFEFLIEQLTEVQVLSLRAMGLIPVHASDGSRWLILPSVAQQAYSLADGQMYCLSPQDKDIPFGDAVLAVVLMLQDDVEDFTAKAREVNGYMQYRNSRAYTVSHHSAFNAMSLIAGVKDHLSISDKHWQDLFTCETEECNQEDDGEVSVCDFHRGTNLVTQLIYESHKWQHMVDLSEMIEIGLTSLKQLNNFTDAKGAKDVDTLDMIMGAVTNMMFDLESGTEDLDDLVSSIQDGTVPKRLEVEMMSLLLN